MNQFTTQLNQRLNDAQEAKEFAHSAQTKRIEKIAPFEVEPDGFLAVMGFMGVGLMILMLGYVVNEFFGDFVAGCVAIALVCATSLYGCFTGLWVPYRMKRWRNKANKLGLSTSELDQVEGFKWFTQTMSASSQLEVIKQCEQAGAMPQQLKRLYELTAENLPYVWWSHLWAVAKNACVKQEEMRQQEAASIARNNAERAAQEEITRKLQQDAPAKVNNNVIPIINSIKV